MPRARTKKTPQKRPFLGETPPDLIFLKNTFSKKVVIFTSKNSIITRGVVNVYYVIKSAKNRHKIWFFAGPAGEDSLFSTFIFLKKHQKTVKNHVFTGTKVNVQKLEKSAFFGDESAAVFSKIFSKFTKLLQTFANFVQNVTKCVMSTFSKSS